MILIVVLVAIVLAAIFQPNAPRLFAAVVLAGSLWLHELALSDLDGLAYYGSDALCNLGVIILISGINPIPALVIRIQIICLLSIILNFLGWVAWYAYLHPLPYNVVFLLLYTWTLIALIRRDNGDVGGYGINAWRSCFRFNAHPWVVNYCKHGETA